MADLQPRPVTDTDCAGWHGERLVLGPNAQGIGTHLEVVLSLSIDEGTGQEVPHVCIPFSLDEISLARLAQGGTLWVCLLGTTTVPLFVTTETDYDAADNGGQDRDAHDDRPLMCGVDGCETGLFLSAEEVIAHEQTHALDGGTDG